MSEEIELEQWYEHKNRRGRVIGDYVVFKTKEGFSYKGNTYNTKGETKLDFTGENPDYDTPEDAREAAIENMYFD